MPRSAVAALARAGWDVVHATDAGLGAASDAGFIERARSESRICVTLDTSFHALLAVSGAEGPSVVRVLRDGLDAAAFAKVIAGVWASVRTDLSAGAVVTVTNRAVRVGRLPVAREAKR